MKGRLRHGILGKVKEARRRCTVPRGTKARLAEERDQIGLELLPGQALPPNGQKIPCAGRASKSPQGIDGTAAPSSNSLEDPREILRSFHHAEPPSRPKGLRLGLGRPLPLRAAFPAPDPERRQDESPIVELPLEAGPWDLQAPSLALETKLLVPLQRHGVHGEFVPKGHEGPGEGEVRMKVGHEPAKALAMGQKEHRPIPTARPKLGELEEVSTPPSGDRVGKHGHLAPEEGDRLHLEKKLLPPPLEKEVEAAVAHLHLRRSDPPALKSRNASAIDETTGHLVVQVGVKEDGAIGSLDGHGREGRLAPGVPRRGLRDPETDMGQEELAETARIGEEGFQLAPVRLTATAKEKAVRTLQEASGESPAQGIDSLPPSSSWHVDSSSSLYPVSSMERHEKLFHLDGATSLRRKRPRRRNGPVDGILGATAHARRTRAWIRKEFPK